MGRTADYFNHEFINTCEKATKERAENLKLALRGLGEWMEADVFTVNDGNIDWDGERTTWCYGQVELPKLGRASGYLVRHREQWRQATVDESRFGQKISAENLCRLAEHIEAYEKEDRWNYRD